METVNDLKRMGYSLFISCGGCRANKVILGPDKAFERYGPFVRIEDIRDISPCSRCGTKGPQIKVDVGMPG